MLVFLQQIWQPIQEQEYHHVSAISGISLTSMRVTVPNQWIPTGSNQKGMQSLSKNLQAVCYPLNAFYFHKHPLNTKPLSEARLVFHTYPKFPTVLCRLF